MVSMVAAIGESSRKVYSGATRGSRNWIVYTGETGCRLSALGFRPNHHTLDTVILFYTVIPRAAAVSHSHRGLVLWRGGSAVSVD